MRASYSFLYQYAIPFTEPLMVKGQRLLQREGIILALKSRNEQHTAYGEIAPLPGLHHETLQAAGEQLLGLFSTRDLASLDSLPPGLFPSVRTGVEMAMINLEAAMSGISPVFSPSGASAERVPLNALLFGDTPHVMQRAEEYFNLGYRTFKLKLTASGMDSAIRSIDGLHRTYGDRMRLRLDANQSLSLDEALDFARQIPQGSIAYIEEPLNHPEHIGEFYAKTAIHSALDETLWQNPKLLNLIPSASLSALILKPNRLGGIRAALRLARYAAEHNLLAVFSSAFESGISLSFYSWLAASTAAEPAACGLDTYRYLEHDLLTIPFVATNGHLEPHKLYREGQGVSHRHLKLTSLWTL